MPKFVIERTFPGIGGLRTGDLQGISQKSCSVLHDHARLGGFPIDSVARVVKTIDPTTAEA